ncbi:hypothetical protein [Pontibacter sp. H249]|uniref:hypothetical protein n=1 Tax=Pontibacter sp. H249 TaxID=3133420 RepID=UPI0030BCFE5D
MRNMYSKSIATVAAFLCATSISMANPTSINLQKPVLQQDTVKSASKSTSHIVSSTKNGHKGNYIYINNGAHVEIKYNGNIVLTDNFKDVKSIAPKGYLHYLKKENGEKRELQIESDKNGQLSRTYFVNGKQVAYEPAGKQWLQQAMPDIITKTGIGLEAMVQDVYKKRGAKGVLAEADKLNSDNSKLRMISYLMAQPNLPTSDLKLALQHAATTSSSDYELSKILRKVSAADLAKDDVAISYLQATQKISSDYEMRKALTHLLEVPNLSSKAAGMAVKTLTSVASDYEKSKVIQQLAGQKNFFTDNYKATFEAIRSISSDYEKSKSISSIVSKQQLSQAQYQALFPVVTTISSDYEKSKVLRNIAPKIPDNATALREDYKKAAKTINSDYEYRKAIDALK